MKKATKYGPSLSVGASHDLRRKLSPEDIKDIKKRAKPGNYTELAKEYGVHRMTIVYHADAYANAQMRNKNRRNRRDWDASQRKSKQRRRKLARPRVREYTRNQMREWRKAHPEEARISSRESSRKRRALLKAKK